MNYWLLVYVILVVIRILSGIPFMRYADINIMTGDSRIIGNKVRLRRGYRVGYCNERIAIIMQ